MAGVAQSHIHLRFAWQAWHSWDWVAWQAWHNLTSTFVSRGRHGTNSHLPSFCVAGVALMGLGGALGPVWSRMTPRHFAWQAWHNPSTFVSRGRRGTNSHLPSFCVAGVALMGLGGALGPVWSRMTPRHFAWQALQAWHNLTSTFVLRGRRGTHGTGWRAWAGLVADDAAALCVAGVAQSHIHLRFAWQAWRSLTSTFVLRGRRGTHGTRWRAWAGLVADDAAALCVAGVAQSHIHLRFAWQAWHKLTSTIVLHGRRGTHGTGWRAWAGLVADDAAALCVAGVAQSPIHLRFAWQAWHNLTSTFVLRGRRGTISHPPSFHVAGVALMGLGGALGPVWSRMTPWHFAWQAWHNLTSTFVLRGRRGAVSHPHSFCVAGVALMGLGGALGPVWSRMTPRHFAWQAWHNLTSTFVSRGRRGTISPLELLKLIIGRS